MQATVLVEKLLSVPGYNQKYNDILFVPKRNNCMASSVIVYFGGDVQDFVEQMKSHRDHGKYTDYSLESTAELLALKFPSSFILVIRPSKLELKTFSCFQNFVLCDDIGTPKHQENSNALLQLSTLLLSVEHLTKTKEIGWDVPITLIGFSKGCVVLNQLLHELHFFYNLPVEGGTHVAHLMKRITKMIWLDGGHSGGSDTWVTLPNILSILKVLNISVDIQVTPYQVRDDRRPWIGKEEKHFFSTLKKLGVNVTRKLHFEDEMVSLDNHFLLLKYFA